MHICIQHILAPWATFATVSLRVRRVFSIPAPHPSEFPHPLRILSCLHAIWVPATFVGPKGAERIQIAPIDATRRFPIDLGRGISRPVDKLVIKGCRYLRLVAGIFCVLS